MDPTKIQLVHDIGRYCYNCAGAGHFGDDCGNPRPWYVQGGRIGVVVSAFGEGNVPEWAKVKDPPKQGKDGNRSKRKVEEVEEVDEDDDGWFGERLQGMGRDHEPPRRKGRSNRPEASLQREAIANAAESKRLDMYSQSYRPSPPRDPSRGRSPHGTSYKQDYASRNLLRNGERDWNSRVNQWRRQREEDDLAPRR